jgi:hypothetical protein
VRLDFNVLWVEDQQDQVLAQAKAIARNMVEEGFELKATMCANPDDVRAHIGDQVFNDEIDLILVDWDLGAGGEGQDVITEIRERIPYKDIVFYSAVTDIKTLRQRSFDEDHEGIYFVSRRELVVEVTNLFHTMIKKVLDLDHTRGIVLGATSDIEQSTRECLLSAHRLLDAEGQAAMLAHMLERLDAKIKDTERRVRKLDGKGVEDILADHFTFTAFDGLGILLKVMELQPLDAYREFQEPIRAYRDDVAPQRNSLGHKVLQPDGRPAGLAAAEGKVVSLDELRTLRKQLLELREQFRNLHTQLLPAH